jgi:ribose transport system substrate-binding protein
MLILVVALVVAVSGCGGDSAPEPAQEEEPAGPTPKDSYTIAFMVKNMFNPFWKLCKIGAEKAAAETGKVRIVHYSPTKPDNIEEQTRMVEDITQKFLAGEIDGMVFVPVDYKALVPALNEALDAGMPIVIYCNNMDDFAQNDRYIAYVGQNDYELGKAIAEYAFSKVDYSGKVVIIEGVPAAITNIDRMRGFHETLQKYPDMELIASQTGQYRRVPGMQVMENLLQTHPQIDVVLSANDDMALGCIEAIEAAGRLGEMVVTGIDGIPDSLASIRAGRLTATIDYSGFRQGYNSVHMIVKALDGEPVDRLIMLDFTVITQDNIEDFLRQLDEIGQPY